jgi:hypothetical protein
MTDASAAVHPLDNPFWSSLATLHRGIALGEGGVLRYPADVAASPLQARLRPAQLRRSRAC